jgi:hypothetical protein
VSDTFAYSEYSAFVGATLLKTDEPPSTDIQSKHVSFIYYSLERVPPTAPGNNETEYNPHLVVARPEITHI